MQNDRRAFLQAVGAASVGAAVTTLDPSGVARLEAATANVQSVSAKDFASNEEFWYSVQKAYRMTSSFIHLESGWFSPGPREVLDAQIAHMERINHITSFFLRRPDQWAAERVDLKRAIGEFAGCSPEEFVLTRNTTESLNTVIMGLEMAPEDELLYSRRDYPSMVAAIEQLVERFGLRRRLIDIPLVPDNDDQVVALYADAITPQTKVILTSHMIFTTGQLVPVRKICDMAHERGVEVIVDAAHSFAHIDFKIPDLNCDYLGTSLHKWLGAPLGNGLLYVRRDKISRVWPLLRDRQFAKDDIRKLEHMGTHAYWSDLTIRDAICFHQTIGSKRKEERLRYLKHYWVNRVKDVPRVQINTPLGDHESCAIANVSVEGLTSAELATQLFERHRVFTVAVDEGIRVSPNLFNSLADLDVLVRGIREAAS